MVDRIDPARRSWNMSRVRSADTAPELVVRRLLFGLGYRYRLHGRLLPGRPDLVFHGRRAVVFVHGCFWHRHENCRHASTPATRTDFWLAKFAENRRRDAAALQSLEAAGWRVLIVWECETPRPAELAERLTAFLGTPGGLSGTICGGT